MFEVSCNHREENASTHEEKTSDGSGDDGKMRSLAHDDARAVEGSASSFSRVAIDPCRVDGGSSEPEVAATTATAATPSGDATPSKGMANTQRDRSGCSGGARRDKDQQVEVSKNTWVSVRTGDSEFPFFFLLSYVRSFMSANISEKPYRCDPECIGQPRKKVVPKLYTHRTPIRNNRARKHFDLLCPRNNIHLTAVPRRFRMTYPGC